MEKASSAAFCSFVGAAVGGAIGSTCGPVGAAIGSAIGGALGNNGGKWLYEDKKKPNDKQIKVALLVFGFGDEKWNELINDKQKFNINDLQHRYRTRAPLNHPDHLTIQGKNQKEAKERWNEFYECYTMLLKTCQKRDQKLKASSKSQ